VLLELEPEPAAARRARDAIAAQMQDRLPERAYEDLRAVVSELVTNSVVHGPGSRITLRLDLKPDGTVAGEITDDGDGIVAVREARGLEGSGGYGLAIVDTLTDRWGVKRDSTDVWFELTS
jgi:anti-sigma regulatory factor (Ser/Thr protein kinase)